MTFNLPDNVRPVKDRHGKTRYRFRKVGHPSKYLKGKPGTREFYASLALALEGKTDKTPAASPRSVKEGTLDDLYRGMKRTNAWQKKAEREYQARFAAHRLHGEWHSPHPDILAEIDRLASSEGE